MVKTIYLDSHFKYIVFFCMRKANACLTGERASLAH